LANDLPNQVGTDIRSDVLDYWPVEPRLVEVLGMRSAHICIVLVLDHGVLFVVLVEEP
jgi:hypothetical protein